MITIGHPQTFALEIHSDDLFAEVAEIYIVVSSKRVSARNPVHVSTFVGEIGGFLESQKSCPSAHDFSSVTDKEVFWLFHSIVETNRETDGISPNDVWHYHRLHSIDDAVDDWEIYVFDSQDDKHIVCRAISDRADLRPQSDELVSTTMPREDFIDTLTEFVGVFNRAKMMDEPS